MNVKNEYIVRRWSAVSRLMALFPSPLLLFMPVYTRSNVSPQIGYLLPRSVAFSWLAGALAYPSLLLLQLSSAFSPTASLLLLPGGAGSAL